MAKTNDKILVKLMNEEDESMIRAFYTSNPTEILKMYYFAKENEIDISVPCNDDGDKDRYTDEIFYIEDITIVFGNTNTFNVINIWVK